MNINWYQENIQKNRKYGKKLGSWHRPDRKDSEKRKCSNEKARQTFLQKLPVSVWRVVNLFKVVIIPVLMMKTHAHADENRNLFLQKQLSVVKGQTFLSSYKRNTDLIISPQAQLTVKVNEIDSDYVSWVNIQKRIKSNIWPAELCYSNFLTNSPPPTTQSVFGQERSLFS